MSLSWTNSKGGPLICATPSAGAAWRGVNASSIGDTRTDYERACDIVDYLGVIPGGGLAVLVLGDEPLQSVLSLIASQPVIVRWVSCLSNERAEKEIASLPSQLPAISEDVEFVVQEPNLFLFDSALYKPSAAEMRCIPVDPGRYKVSSESYMSAGAFEFLVHRFKKMLI